MYTPKVRFRRAGDGRVRGGTGAGSRGAVMFLIMKRRVHEEGEWAGGAYADQRRNKKRTVTL
ncbi:hypothetical protein GCM10010841_00640 [Deinococcus aerophilus]|uniref:Uncharacterized protein n=1 Tax=Deinococcus aerophilus TaxID=522488 RepID=A0ABQ2GH02_9DEIO|nr:hypothetical protein GCM10010841_00640 [Deinococcus aerophilus]